MRSLFIFKHELARRTVWTTVALSIALVASAQAQQSATEGGSDRRGAMEEVTVTATRRVESIQDVPVSVSTVGADTIEKTGVFDMGELSRYIPNFEFSDASILPNLYVRGIGSGTTHSIEQSVGRFIDDVYISATRRR